MTISENRCLCWTWAVRDAFGKNVSNEHSHARRPACMLSCSKIHWLWSRQCQANSFTLHGVHCIDHNKCYPKHILKNRWKWLIGNRTKGQFTSSRNSDYAPPPPPPPRKKPVHFSSGVAKKITLGIKWEMCSVRKKNTLPSYNCVRQRSTK